MPNEPFSNDLKDAHPFLQQAFPKFKAAFEVANPGLTVNISFVWRSVAYQQELYKIGRRGVVGEKVVTNCDGVIKVSNHCRTPSRAIDCVVRKGKTPLWDDATYAKFIPLAKSLGLVAGAGWKWKDNQHLELPSSVV